MNLRTFGCTVAMLVEGTGAAQLPVATTLAPQVDHHQHLLSPALAAAWSEPEPVTADRLIAQLDSAGVRRALVLSLAYAHGSPSIRGDDEYAQVRGENDWTSQQVARYPGRLHAFCSFNPLREYALAELDRCGKDPNLRYGVKLHFANSQVDLQNPGHVQRILYGSDMAIGANPPARESWGAFRAMLPLTDAEFRTIADNVAPYMR